MPAIITLPLFIFLIVGLIKPTVFSFGSFKATRLKIFGIWFLVHVVISFSMSPRIKETQEVVSQAENVESNTSKPETNKAEVKLEPKKAISKWRIWGSKDEMRNAITAGASLKSNNEVNFDFPYDGGSYLTVNLRKDPKYGNDVYFEISKGQFTCITGCSGSIKFDEGAVQKIRLVGGSAGNSDVVFIEGSKSRANFAAQIKKSKKMMIELEFYRYGDRLFIFDTEGLDWKYF